MATKIFYFIAYLCLCRANPLYPTPCEVPNTSGIKPCDKGPNFNLGPYGLLGPLGGLNNFGPLGPTVIETPNVYNGYNGYTIGINAPGSNGIETMPPISIGMDIASLSRLLGVPVVEAMPALSLNMPKGIGSAPIYEATAIPVGSVGYGPVYETPTNIGRGVGYNVAPVYESPAMGLGNFAPIYEPVSLGGLGYGFSNVAPIYEPSIGIGYGNLGPVFEPAMGFGGLSYGVGNIGPIFETPVGFGVSNVAPVYEAPVWPSFGSVGYSVGNVGPIFETPVAVGGYGMGNASPVYETPGMGYGGYGLGLHPYTGLGKSIFS